VLKAIAADPDRSMVVIDPRRSETADLADYWLGVAPGTDAFLLAAIGAVLVEEHLTADRWLTENTEGAVETQAAFGSIPVGDFAQRCGIDEARIRDVARRLARASSVVYRKRQPGSFPGRLSPVPISDASG